MAVRQSKILLFVVICLFCQTSFSQDYTPKLGPYSNKNEFKYNAEDTKRLDLRRHVPKNSKVIAYNKDGKEFELKTTDTVRVADIYEGTWDGKKGKWIMFYDTNLAFSQNVGVDYYVLLSDMKDVKSESRAAENEKDKEVKRSGKTARTVFFTSVFPITLLLLATIFFFRRFYIGVAAKFSMFTANAASGCLGFMLLVPIAIYVQESFSRGRTNKHIRNILDFIYTNLNVDPKMLFTTDLSTLSWSEVFYYEFMMILTGIFFVFFTWIGIGLLISGIIVVLSSLGHGGAQGVSYDGGRTIHYYSSGSGSADADIPFDRIVKF